MQQGIRYKVHKLSGLARLLSALILPGILSAPCAHATNLIAQQTLSELDKQTLLLSNKLIGHLAQDMEISNTLSELRLNVARHYNNGDRQLAVATIKANLQLVKKHIDDKAIFRFLAILLEYNDKKTADELFNIILEDGDKSLLSRIILNNSSVVFQHKNNRK